MRRCTFGAIAKPRHINNRTRSKATRNVILPKLRKPARYQKADAVTIARLWRSAWMSANPDVTQVEPLERWLARVRDEFAGLQVTLCFMHPGKLAAFIAVDVKRCYVHQLFVDPDCQGQGIGTQMIQQVCALCPDGWSLHVARSNVRARNFYARNHLLEGDGDVNPISGRARVSYSWRPPRP